MPSDCYAFSKVGNDLANSKESLISIITYSFKTPANWYLVEVEKYKQNAFVIKYFLKKHKKHKFRYNLLSNEFKCRPVVMTVINILLEILNKKKLASFAFIGSHTTDN